MTPKPTLSPWRKFDAHNTVTSNRNAADGEFRSGQVIEFAVFHKPMGAPRMTQKDEFAQRECVLAYRAFKDAIRRDSPILPKADRIESLSWVAYFVPPKGKLPLMNQLHRNKPDRDNIDKAILDALFDQDQAIAAGNICKRWGNEDKLVITIVVE